MGPRASRSSILRWFADVSHGSGRTDFLKVFSRGARCGSPAVGGFLPSVAYVAFCASMGRMSFEALP
jgi:hypothetical protein